MRLFRVSPKLLPPPTEVAAAIAGHFGLLAANSVPTAAETLGGFLLAAGIGFLLGAALSASRLARDTLPWILVAQIVPKIALAPLFVVWLGVGAPCRLAFAVFIAFFPVLVATVAGLGATDPAALRLCAALGARGWQTVLRVRLPYAVPHILAGLKTAATLSLLGVVLGEFVTAQQGLGYLVLFAGSIDETALMLAAVVLLCVIGVALYGLVLLAEALFARWYGGPDGGGRP
ncbi:MAG: ABC transporter permease [Acetobacteraceae bacterium]